MQSTAVVRDSIITPATTSVPASPSQRGEETEAPVAAQSSKASHKERRSPADEKKAAGEDVASAVSDIPLVSNSEVTPALALPSAALKSPQHHHNHPLLPPPQPQPHHQQPSAIAAAKSLKPPRDPLAPKRPPSSFLLFLHAMREQVKQANPQMSYLDVTRHIGQMWETADKKKFEEESAKLLETYRKELGEYEEKKQVEAQKTHEIPSELETVATPAAVVAAAEEEVAEEGELKNKAPKRRKKKGNRPTTQEVLASEQEPPRVAPATVPSPASMHQLPTAEKGGNEKILQSASTHKSSNKRLDDSPSAKTSLAAHNSQEFFGEKGPLVSVPAASSAPIASITPTAPSSALFSSSSPLQEKAPTAPISIAGGAPTAESSKPKKKKKEKNKEKEREK